MSAYGAEYGGPLSGDQIQAIIEYLRSLEETEYKDLRDVIVEGDPANGEQLYGQYCASCHGEVGDGETAISLNNPYFLATASDGYIRYAINQGRPGTPMKSFATDLEASEIDDITRYIRTWARTVEPSKMAWEETAPSLESIVLNPEAPQAQFEHPRRGRFISAEKVKEALEQEKRLVLLDARPRSDWLRGHIPGAFPAPFYAEQEIQSLVQALPRDGTWIVAYCACPHAASGKVVDRLRKAGFENTGIIDEGILVWAERGYPMVLGNMND